MNELTQAVAVPEVPVTPLPDWVLDNLQRQAREFFLEEEIIPHLKGEQAVNLTPITAKIRTANKALKEIDEKRLTVPVKQLSALRKEEITIRATKKILVEDRKAKVIALGFKAQIDEAVTTAKAHRFHRQMDIATQGYSESGVSSLKSEAKDIETYLGWMEKQKILRKFKGA